MGRSLVGHPERSDGTGAPQPIATATNDDQRAGVHPENAGERQPRLVGYRVLVLEDDPDQVDLLTEVLEPLGAVVIPASTAEAARKLLDSPLDLALVDVNLGPVSGFEFVEELRRWSCLPVIILTARTAEDDAVHGLLLGADDYVRKPFSIPELVARIERQLQRG